MAFKLMLNLNLQDDEDTIQEDAGGTARRIRAFLAGAVLDRCGNTFVSPIQVTAAPLTSSQGIAVAAWVSTVALCIL